MIFYLVESDPHFLVGTQADAKREARERKCSWSQVDVPTDKPALMSYVNSLMERASAQAHIKVTGSYDGPPDVPSLRAVAYESPWGARSVIADMDVNAMTKCVAQLDGVRLAKVVTAALKRMEELNGRLTGE